MALTGSERDFRPSLFDRVTGALTVTRGRHEGRARLVFADGRSFPVEARIVLCRSLLSSWGDGYIHCAADIGFEALRSRDWLTLAFDGGALADIEVKDVKACNAQSRCRFEVMS